MAVTETDLSRYARLFLDDGGIEDYAFVERRRHQPRKLAGPVLEAGTPWEQLGITCYGSVRHWRGLFRAWYTTWNRVEPFTGGARPSASACYAESRDGIHWEKPALDFQPAGSGAGTNIVLVSEAHGHGGKIDDLCVFVDDDAEWPLSMIYWDSAGTFGKADPAGGPPFGFYLARSRDGQAWEKEGLVLPGVGDRFNGLPEKWGDRYVLYTRGLVADRKTRLRGRSVYRVESGDLRTWGAFERVLSADPEDPAAMEHYSLAPWPYEGLLLGVIERFHCSPDILDCELTWSGDGRKWERAGRREPFLPIGEPGTFDQSWVALPSSAPIPVGAQLWFYYSGRSGAHGSPWPHSRAALGLATLRRDGFCSLEAGARPGFVTTRPLTWPGGDLLANYDCRRDVRAHPGANTGELLVEALGEDGEPIEGFSRDDCDMRRSNTATANTWEPERACYFGITWREGRGSLRELAGQTFRLRFHLRDARIYSFRSGDWRGMPWK